MKKVRITVKKIARYDDLIEQYENPMEHACGMALGHALVQRRFPAGQLSAGNHGRGRGVTS